MSINSVEKVGLMPKLKTAALLYHSLATSGLANAKSKNFWDKCSDDFLYRLIARHLTNPHIPERRELVELVASFNPRTLLDSGCGPASTIDSYCSNQRLTDTSYVGLDMSRRMLAVASKKYPKLNFVHGDINQLPFLDNSFDVVVLKHVLEHQEQGYKDAVVEAVRVARKGVIISFFHTPLPFIPDLKIFDKDGFPNNWYNSQRFDKFLGSLVINEFTKHDSIGTAGQMVSLYRLKLH